MSKRLRLTKFLKLRKSDLREYLHSVIARYEAIANGQSGYASLPVQFGIASYLAMTLS